MTVRKSSNKKSYSVFESLLTQEFGKPVKELVFHPTRKWRFDYAYPDQKIAIEIEGLTRPGTKSRHTENDGYKKDCIKYNEAAVLGWRVIRLTQDMTLRTATFELLRKVLLPK